MSEFITKVYLSTISSEIDRIKNELKSSESPIGDYHTNKYVEGHYTEEEFEIIKENREKAREKIRFLSKELENPTYLPEYMPPNWEVENEPS